MWFVHGFLPFRKVFLHFGVILKCSLEVKYTLALNKMAWRLATLCTAVLYTLLCLHPVFFLCESDQNNGFESIKKKLRSNVAVNLSYLSYRASHVVLQRARVWLWVTECDAVPW